MRLFKLLGILSFCFPVFAASSSIPDEICALLPSSLPTPKPSKLWAAHVDTLPTLTAETYKVIVHQFTHYAQTYEGSRDCKMRYLRCIPESLLFVTPDGSATIITIPDRIFLSQDNVHYYQSSARLFSENPPVITDDEITFYDHRYQKKELPHVASLCFFYLPADRLAFYKILEHKPKTDAILPEELVPDYRVSRIQSQPSDIEYVDTLPEFTSETYNAIIMHFFIPKAMYYSATTPYAAPYLCRIPESIWFIAGDKEKNYVLVIFIFLAQTTKLIINPT